MIILNKYLLIKLNIYSNVTFLKIDFRFWERTFIMVTWKC